MELAHALLARTLFPDAPLKWMPPTKHMTGDIFRGYLLDGFFNLVGAMTGQGILLVGMMTEAVVTPFLSDRDLALQNVRYVMNAASGLTEDFHPPRDGFIQTRARHVLSEAVDLLDRIVHDGDAAGDAPLLAAIADGTFGLMKRPANGGKGLDGVCERAEDYDNPATTALDAWTPPASHAAYVHGERHPMSAHIVRPYGDTTGDGMVQMSFTLPLPHDKRAEGAALQLARKMGLDPALLVHAKAMGPDFTFFVVYGSHRTWSNVDDVHVVEREYPLLTAKDINADDQASSCAASSSSSGRASAPTRTRSASTPSSTSRASPARRASSTTARSRSSTSGPRCSCPSSSPGRAPRRPTPSSSARSSRRRTRTSTTRPRCPRPSGRPTRPGRCRSSSSAARASRRAPPKVLGVDRIFGRGTTPGEVASYLVHETDPTNRRRSHDRTHDHGERRAAVTHRRYVPYSHAHYAGNLVDGAYSLAAFGDVATEMCIVTDGDEGLFASYSDVQFKAPVRAGDVIEISAEIVRVGTRSREMDFEVRVVARGNPSRGASAADPLDPAIVATTARGVVVVP